MRLVKLAIALATLALALPACESAPEGPVAPTAPAFADHNQDGVVDGNDFMIWWGPSLPGSGNLRIYEGARTPASTSDDDDDGLIFEFANGSIIGRTSPSSGTPDDDDVVFGPIAHIVAPQIFDPHGNPLCEADYGDQPGTHQLRDADGEVLFTVWERLVFKGAAADWLDRAKGYGFLKPEHGDDLRFSYNNFQIHRGWWPDGEVLATATAIIQHSSPMVHLLIAAMIDGKCGSLGIG